MDGGEYSNSIDVEQGRRQWCVLAPLLFNIFFAAVPRVVLQRPSEDLEILAGLVHVHEPAAEGATDGAEKSDDPLVKVMRAVRGILYADDAGIVSLSSQELASVMTIIVEICKEFVLTVSEIRLRLCACQLEGMRQRSSRS